MGKADALVGIAEDRSSSVFLDVGRGGPDRWGAYRDRCVRTAAGWRIDGRCVRSTGLAPGSTASRVTAELTGPASPRP